LLRRMDAMGNTVMTQLLGRFPQSGFSAFCLAAIALCAAVRGAAANPPNDSTKSQHVIAVSDTDAIRAAMAHEVKLVGTVGKVQESGEILLIHFKGAEKADLNAVVLERNREAVEKAHGEGLKSIEGKRVQIAGKLGEYRDKPQIVVSKPGQITLANE